jgi:hypothetical protein
MKYVSLSLYEASRTSYEFVYLCFRTNFPVSLYQRILLSLRDFPFHLLNEHISIDSYWLATVISQ